MLLIWYITKTRESLSFPSSFLAVALIGLPVFVTLWLASVPRPSVIAGTSAAVRTAYDAVSVAGAVNTFHAALASVLAACPYRQSRP